MAPYRRSPAGCLECWGPRSDASGRGEGGRGVGGPHTPRLPFFPLTPRCLDWNRDILKKELGLTEQDIIDLPALFKMDESRQARAFFPNMVRCSGLQTSPEPSVGAAGPRGTPRLRLADREVQAQAPGPAELLRGPPPPALTLLGGLLILGPLGPWGSLHLNTVESAL